MVAIIMPHCKCKKYLFFPDVSKHGEKMDMKARLISDGQSGKSEEDGQKLLVSKKLSKTNQDIDLLDSKSVYENLIFPLRTACLFSYGKTYF